jgi:alkylation response protein AidB-like acyl-CoA dehydrogenase
VYFDDCRVPAANRLGEEGGGQEIANQAADFSRLGVAFMALGACERALEEGIGYSTQRRQFNMPIAQKQAIQNYIANSYAETESIRLHAYYAASLPGKPAFPLAVSTAKLVAATASRFVSDKILQVHGGYGYMKESVIERIYRDVRALSIIEGTSELQRFQIASRVYADHGLAIPLGGV